MKTPADYLREAIKVSEQSVAAGNTVSTEHDCTGHAETNLVHMASKQYSREVFARGQRKVAVSGPRHEIPSRCDLLLVYYSQGS